MLDGGTKNGSDPEHIRVMFLTDSEGDFHLSVWDEGQQIWIVKWTWPRAKHTEAHAKHLADCGVGQMVRESEPGTMFTYTIQGE